MKYIGNTLVIELQFQKCQRKSIENLVKKLEIGNWKFKRHLKLNRNNNEIPMKIQLSFQWIPVEISMKQHWKSIGNPVGNAIKKSWNFNEIPMEIIGYQVKISMKLKWKSIGNLVGIQ